MGGGKDVGDHRRNMISRRPRPRPHHLRERSPGVGAAAMAAPAGTVPAVAAAAASRRSSAAPVSIVSENPPAILFRQGGSGSGGAGGGTAVGGATSGTGDGRRRSRSVDMVGHNHNSRRSGDRGDGGNDANMFGYTRTTTAQDGHSPQRTAPSPPKQQHDRRPSEGRLSDLPAGVVVIGTTTSSPMRRLRNTRLRSPESASETRSDREADALLSGTNGTSRSEGGRVGGRSGSSEETEERCSLDVATSGTKREVDGPGDVGEVV